MIRTGLEVFLEAPDVAGPVGLLTNVASLTRDGRTALRALSESGIAVGMLFAPEHGYYAIGATSELIADDWLGSIPIYSLFGMMRLPPVELLHSVSTVLIDLQDTGARWHTFLATIQDMLRACAAAEIPVLLLDRPNPQGGVVVEGMRARPEHFSFIAPAAVPVRYGLTIGEIARLFNAEIGAQLDVIPMRGWRRDMLFVDTGLCWSAPSPGIPHPLTPLIYTGTRLIEGVNLSEGRGTPLPFEQIGAPFVVGEVLAEELNALELPGAFFTPAWFRPVAGKYAGETCEGVRVHITQPHQFQGFTVGLYMIEMLRRLYPAEVVWSSHEDRYTFDRLVGNMYIRQAMEHGQTAAEILTSCQDDARVFQAESSTVWLYDY